MAGQYGKGEKIRAKQGDGDNGISCDFGQPLPEEEEFLKRSFRDKKGQLLYNWPDSDEPYSEDQVGEEYVSRIWTRFTGIELFEDEELHETLFRAYRLNGFKNPSNFSQSTTKKTFWQRLFG